MKILSVDVGTTAMKMGVFEESNSDLALVKQFSREYSIHTYNDGLFSDIEQEKWQQAFAAGSLLCNELAPGSTVSSFITLAARGDGDVVGVGDRGAEASVGVSSGPVPGSCCVTSRCERCASSAFDGDTRPSTDAESISLILPGELGFDSL